MTTYYIYKICCNDNACTDFYIGSTQNVRQRKSKHKTNCNSDKSNRFNLLVYKKIREYGGWDNWRMVVIEEMPNTTLIQARIREEHYRLELQATLNMFSAYNGLARDEYFKKYREENKEEIAERNKEYYENKKDAILEQQKVYYEKNKDAINARTRERWAKKKAEKNAVNLAEKNITK